MNKIFIFLVVAFLSVGFLVFIPVARAVTPTLSLSTSGQSGDYVQVNVNGDPNASVFLFSGVYSIFLGNISSSGLGSFSVGSAQSENQIVAIATNQTVYVKTGGINGATSNQVMWPYINSNTNTGSLALSQTALLLNPGQTTTQPVTASSNSLYLLSNSSPAVANFNFNANQITVQALTYGNTVANICAVGSTTACANLTVTVQNSSTSQQLTFSQNNFSIVSGQNVFVNISGGSGVYNQPQSSNSSIVQASLNGNIVTLTAGSTTGSASITVCTTDMTNCGIINVSATTLNSTSITFSQSNPIVPIGQSVTITIFGGTGTNFYVSSNSNPSIVQPNILGNILTLIGSSGTGTSSISVCAYAGTCATLSATVSNVSTNGGGMALSQSSISILAGQSSNITISGGSTPYSFSSPNSTNIFNGVINGNVLTIYGVNPGSGTASVCSSIGCTPLSVTINSTTNSTNPPTFSQNNILLNAGQQSAVNVSGIGNFYVANNTYPNVATVSINGNSAVVTALNSGNSAISICQNGGLCTTLYVTVNPPVIITATPTPTPAPTPSPATSKYIFTRNLKYNDKGTDVLELQKILMQLGYLTATPTGRYGPATVTAVKKLQAVHKIRQLGNVGPATMAFLNQLQIIVK